MTTEPCSACGRVSEACSACNRVPERHWITGKRAALTVAGLAVFFVAIVVVTLATGGEMAKNFSIAESVFSGIAMLGVIAAIILQREELRLQREELAETRQELQKAADAQEQTADALKQSAAAAGLQADAAQATLEFFKAQDLAARRKLAEPVAYGALKQRRQIVEFMAQIRAVTNDTVYSGSPLMTGLHDTLKASREIPGDTPLLMENARDTMAAVFDQADGLGEFPPEVRQDEAIRRRALQLRDLGIALNIVDSAIDELTKYVGDAAFTERINKKRNQFAQA
jgi:hypothetical protein